MKINHRPLDKAIKSWYIADEPIKFSGIYNVDEIFEDIPGNTEEILFKIPDEILAETGWGEGDVIEIETEGNSLIIKKKDVAENRQTA